VQSRPKLVGAQEPIHHLVPPSLHLFVPLVKSRLLACLHQKVWWQALEDYLGRRPGSSSRIQTPFPMFRLVQIHQQDIHGRALERGWVGGQVKRRSNPYFGRKKHGPLLSKLGGRCLSLLPEWHNVKVVVACFLARLGGHVEMALRRCRYCTNSLDSQRAHQYPSYLSHCCRGRK
jgi:hypothetical protein